MQLVQLGSTQIGDFSSDAVERVLRRDLDRLDVQLVDNDPAGFVEASHLAAKSGSLPIRHLHLGDGHAKPAVNREAGLEVDAHDRIIVDGHLRSSSHPFVLAVSDAAKPLGPTGAPYRLSALTAAVSGVYAAQEAACALQGGKQREFTGSTFAQAVAVGRFGALFPRNPNDRQVGLVLGGRAGRIICDVLVRPSPRPLFSS